MDIQKIKEMIKEYYDINLYNSKTVRILAEKINEFMEENHISDDKTVQVILGKSSTENFIMKREPYYEEVPDKVIQSIDKYFSESLMNIVPVMVCRMSNHQDDKYLYGIIGKYKNFNQYACWTSWNQDDESLNFGHYHLPDYDFALNIIQQHFFHIDGTEKIGPEYTYKEINSKSTLKEKELMEAAWKQKIEKEDAGEENNILSFPKKRSR